MKRLSLLFTTALIAALASCGTPSTVETQSPTAQPAPTAQPEPTVAPTATVEPTAAPTELPIATYTAELSATVVASLPPTPVDPGSPAIEGAVALPLRPAGDGPPLWAAFTYGLHSFDPPQQHFVAIYTRDGAGWRELSKLNLENSDYVYPTGVQQVDLAPGRIWLEVQSGAGAHGGCYDLLSFDGKDLRDEVSHCHESPGAGSVADVNGDGVNDVVLNQTQNYIFCYACGVRKADQKVLRWDGQKLAPVELTHLPESAPAELRRLTNRAVDLAEHGLWKDARATISQTVALGASDATATWDAALIRLTAEARAEQAGSGAYPLLDNLFYGDYPAALDAMRPYAPEQLFAADTPLVVGTTAESWVPELTAEITGTTELALKLQPDLAAASFLHGWALHLASPADPAALADVERAAQLAPGDKLFSESLAYLRKK